MADCVVCAYPMIHVASGYLKGVTLEEDAEAKKVMEDKEVELNEADTPVNCYVCPECGHCTWLET